MVIYLKLLSTAVFWGGTFIAGRHLGRHLDAYSSAFLRFAIAGTALLISIRLIEGKFPRIGGRSFVGIICLGLTGIFAYNVFFFKGLQSVTAGRASLIIALNPVSISLISAIVFKEKLIGLKAVGIGLSVFGAVVVITHGDVTTILSDSLTRGDLLIFGCVASWAAYSIIGKLVLEGLSPLVSVGYSSVVGAFFLLPAALTSGLSDVISEISLVSWGALAYLGICGTVLGFFWYYEGLVKIGPIRTSVFINFVPISAIILAYLILDEPITTSLAVGAMMVIGGAFLTNYSAKNRNAEASKEKVKWK